MRATIFDNGLITDEQLKKIAYLSYSHENREINAMLARVSKKLKYYIKLSFVLELISSLSLFLTLVFISYLFYLNNRQLLTFLILFLVFQLFVLLVRYRKLKYLFRYKNVVRDLSDNLLSSIFDDYKLSLGEILPSHPQVKKITKDIAFAAESLVEQLSFAKELIALIVGTIILICTAWISHNGIFAYLSAVVIAIVIFYIIYAAIEGAYYVYEDSYKKSSENYDASFINSQPLLTRTLIGFEENHYLEKVRSLSNLHTNKNVVEAIVKYMIPIVLLVMPFAFKISADFLIFPLVGIFISNRLFHTSNPIKNNFNLVAGIKKIGTVNGYLEDIINFGTEITPNIYKKIKHEYLEKNNNAEISDHLVWGDLKIKNLNYTSGKNDKAKQVLADNLILPYGKISILVGQKSIGKSIFGRILTLRYSDFEADKLLIGDKDIRTFSSLDTGLRLLHYSELRDVSSSYRNILSMYLKQDISANSFVRSVFRFKQDISCVESFLAENKDYYKSLIARFTPLIKDNAITLLQDDSENGLPQLVSEIFQKVVINENFDEYIDEMERKIGKELVSKALIYTAIAEYISFSHLKKYVTEASVHFMDARLDEAPISKEMKLRFLYAIDVFIEGLVFVVDEPFTNLSTNNTIKIFSDFIDYAKTYNAVVLILDENINSEVIEVYKNKNVLGKLLRFEEDDYAMKIKSNDFE